jgi:hypothetical protein
MGTQPKPFAMTRWPQKQILWTGRASGAYACKWGGSVGRTIGCDSTSTWLRPSTAWVTAAWMYVEKARWTERAVTNRAAFVFTAVYLTCCWEQMWTHLTLRCLHQALTNSGCQGARASRFRTVARNLWQERMKCVVSDWRHPTWF